MLDFLKRKRNVCYKDRTLMPGGGGLVQKEDLIYIPSRISGIMHVVTMADKKEDDMPFIFHKTIKKLDQKNRALFMPPL